MPRWKWFSDACEPDNAEDAPADAPREPSRPSAWNAPTSILDPVPTLARQRREVDPVTVCVEHPVRRPEWTCGACGQPWPCPPARITLGEQYAGRRVRLAVYMSAQLHQAVAELPAPLPAPAELFERFILWTR